MRLLVLALLSVASMSASISGEPISNVNSYELLYKFLKDFKVIHEPGHPVFFEGTAYYWYGFYTMSPELPQTCIILCTDPEWPFEGSVFINGTVPRSALFGCKHGHACRGRKCIEPLSYFNVVSYCLMGFVLFLLVCLCGGEPKPRKQRSERPRRRAPREPSFDNVFLPRDHCISLAVPPRYTQ